jgi:class 3 adenylate cyclase/tetratricopeptide (TPR) repeat protein
MRCSKCGAENPDRAKFCNDCGHAIAGICQKCGFENLRSAKFCGECGAPLGAAFDPPVRERSLARPLEVTGEYRHLTVLFSDLVDSTEIASRLDPEEWRDLVASYQGAAAQALRRFGGHIAQFLGDGVLAYFGWPQAHENDAERAVLGGLEILSAVTALNRSELSVRIGIHSGSAVIGAVEGRDLLAFGDTPNVASRVQSVAEPGSVLITRAVYHMISNLFIFEERGLHHFKGVASDIELFRVIRPAATRNRSKAARDLTAFVGRDQELRLLLDKWEQTVLGRGQVVVIASEPGIGKSRLVRQFCKSIGQAPHTLLECAGDQLACNTPFSAASELLRHAMGESGVEGPEQRLELLERSLMAAKLNLQAAVPLVATILNLPLPERYQPLLAAPEEKRRRLLGTLAQWLIGCAGSGPVLIVNEDLQWADASSLELARLLVERGAKVPLMQIYTARPEFTVPWSVDVNHTHLKLNHLSAAEAREMVDSLAAGAHLEPDTISGVLERTSGVPLFVEELARLVLDHRGSPREIPVTLRGSLLARLDQLGPAKEVAQLASVVGREFGYELLRAVSQISDAELQSALEKLCTSELLFAEGVPPSATYAFKHVLIQEAAYQTLLKSRRRELHRAVADVLSAKFSAVVDERPELLARHWSAAGEPKLAFAAWRRAGNTARGRYAFEEAEKSYREALDILNTMPESSDRDQAEIDLLGHLYRVLVSKNGYSARDTVETHKHATALAKKSGNLSNLTMTAAGAWLNALISGDHVIAAALADQVLELAQLEGTRATLAHAHSLQMTSRFYRGDLAGALKYSSAGVPLFVEPHFRSFPGAAAHAFGLVSWTAFMTGRADHARTAIGNAVAEARAANSPYELAYALVGQGYLFAFMRDSIQAESVGAEGLSLSEQQGFPYTAALSCITLGWARAELGHAERGIALIQEGLQGIAQLNAPVALVFDLTLLSAAQASNGALGDALESIESALQLNPAEVVFRPEALRMRGELRNRLGRPDQAEADFRESLALARQLGAKAWELRTAVSLARILRSRSERYSAGALLAPIYASLAERFDTADLKDAKALLEELST